MRPAPEAGEGRNFPAKSDQFSLPQALRDWLHLITTPNVFFETEQDAAGFKSPLAVLMAYTLAFGVVWCLIAFASALFNAGSLPAVLVLGSRAATSLLISLGVSGLLFAAPLHGVSRLCGGTGMFSGTFRAVIYALAPYILLSLALALLSLPFPTISLSTSLRQNPTLLVSYVWHTILLVKGIRATQNTSPAGAFTTVAVTYLALGVLVFALMALGLVGHY